MIWMFLALGAFAQGVCGDGVIDLGEECDDSNTFDGDGCSAMCFLEGCGNGLVEANEQCDDFNVQGGDGCDANCLLEVCGNRRRDVGEQCDDGNVASGDGCSAVCQFENGSNLLAGVCFDGRTVLFAPEGAESKHAYDDATVSAIQKAQVMRGAAEWSNVPDSGVQGVADFSFVEKVAGILPPAWRNGQNDVIGVQTLDHPDDIAATDHRFDPEACKWLEVDLLFRFHKTSLDNVYSEDIYPYIGPSLAGIALHEWGHVFGLGHIYTEISTMEPTPPNGGNAGGDPGGQLRIGALEYKALRSRNGIDPNRVLLSKFVNEPPRGGDPLSYEEWTDSLSTPARGFWWGCPGVPSGDTVYGGTPYDGAPSHITAWSYANTDQNVTVRWALVTAGGDCLSSPYEAAIADVLVQPGRTTMVTPTVDLTYGGQIPPPSGNMDEVPGICTPTLAPDGPYKLCAAVVGGSNPDQVVYSDKDFVVDGGDFQCEIDALPNNAGCDGVPRP